MQSRIFPRGKNNQLADDGIGMPVSSFNNASKNSKNHQPKGFLANFMPYLSLLNFVLLIGVAVLVGIIYMSINTANSSNSIIADVRRVASISSSIVPIDVIQLDQNILETVRNANDIQKEVYKNAQSGDHVVVFDGRFIIYRQNGQQIVYDGPSPSQIAASNQNNLIDNIVKAAKAKGAITATNNEKPNVSVITDANLVKKEDPIFYDKAEIGDVVAIFQSTNVIALYRTKTNEIYNFGRVTTTIRQ